MTVIKESGRDFTAFAVCGRPRLLRLALALVGDAPLADEIVTEVLGRAFEHWDKISVMAHPDAYLRRMVANEYTSIWRRWRRTAPQFDMSPHMPASEDVSQLHGERDAVLRRLAALPRKQRAVVTLRFYEGLSNKDIADILNCGEGTVRSQLSRALQKLRIDLQNTDS